jgi:hypothetical protein
VAINSFLSIWTSNSTRARGAESLKSMLSKNGKYPRTHTPTSSAAYDGRRFLVLDRTESLVLVTKQHEAPFLCRERNAVIQSLDLSIRSLDDIAEEITIVRSWWTNCGNCPAAIFRFRPYPKLRGVVNPYPRWRSKCMLSSAKQRPWNSSPYGISWMTGSLQTRTVSST